MKNNIKEKFEKWAKEWDEKIPNLSKALRSEDLQNSISDMEEFEGWIRCTTSNPRDEENVLVTNGKEVWIGDFSSKRDKRYGQWAVIYNGAPPFDSTEIIAWTYLPSIPPELQLHK